MSRRTAPSSSATVSLFATAAAGTIAMAAAMGFGRFSYTPILPSMMSGLPLSAADAGTVASANFIGYLLGAVAASYGWAGGRERRVALAALAANAALLAAMGAVSSVAAFAAIRFLAGIASAFAMIFTSSIVLSHGAAARNDHVQAAHFGGPGLGIALSSLMVLLIGSLMAGSPSTWRADWLVGALVSALALLLVFVLLPAGPAGSGTERAEPRIAWTMPMVLTTLSYGIFGFGYVITATFLVTIARQSAAGQAVEFLSWFVAGLAAAVALFLWRPIAGRIGIGRTYVAALVVESLGVLASVALPPATAPILGGLLFGATFLAITAYGLQLGRHLSAQSPRRAFAMMTAAFGLGQILGPIVAGFIAERSGSFTLPTVLAAATLVVSALLMAPILSRVP